MGTTDAGTEAAEINSPPPKETSLWFRWFPFNPWVRCVVAVYGSLLFVLLAIQVSCLLLLWKSLDTWVSFSRDFATSPAMAGLAALGAAIIGARALKKQLDQTMRQLDHTKTEAAHARTKDAETSWWEKFEWVTDRVLHEDPKQAKLEKPLALDLLRSLHQMATADFQRAAVDGVIDHYLGPSNEEDLKAEDQPVRNLNAELRALRALDEVTKGASGSSRAVAAAVRGAMYEQSALDALMELNRELEIHPRIPSGNGRMRIADAVLTIDGRRAVLEFKGWSNFSRRGAVELARMATEFLPALEAHDFLVITSAEIPTGVNLPGGHFIHWLPEEGSAALQAKITKALASASAN